jgi:hypothetical protein
MPMDVSMNQTQEEEKEEDKEEEEEEEASGPEERSNGMMVCAEKLATRIHRLIVKSIIPQLHGCLTQKVSSIPSDNHFMNFTCLQVR